MERQVTPETAREVLKNIEPGDHVRFEKGHYKQSLFIRLGNLHEEGAPQTIFDAEKGVVIGAGVSADDFREEGNERSIPDGTPEHSFPGLYPFIDEAHVTIRESRGLEWRGFHFEESWPTHIFLDRVRDVRLVDCHFLDATFAIGATGRETYGIEIEDCSWLQDRVPGRIWRKIPWWRMHGAEGDGYPPVDVKGDWRMFDGDFFRSLNIRGGVAMRRCRIGQAFNAFHMYNDDYEPDVSLDVEIHDCDFFEIRDNVLEAEQACTNWWFHNNRVWNTHKPLSLEIRGGGGLFLFANRFWFDSVQGPQGYDANRGGGMFKFGKKPPKSPMQPSYFFHNSIASRSDYARKGRLAGLQHFNNALRFVRRGTDYSHFIEDLPEIFGNLSADPSLPEYIRDRFAIDWAEYDISFRNDVVFHEAWPGILMDNGYNEIASASSQEPGFADWLTGDFRLSEGSPCRVGSMARSLALPAGGHWTLAGGQDIGALQGEKLTEGPPFKAVGNDG
ncbi:hypothetical protein [Aestuariispira insulae]|uniref:Parallel beta helix pectate lyase-like protein n=1 Tax=Aestuariispira insulae TaxID=1461337 RepID=A0A3D9HRD2_9PROT|nr:hypothetical protein [Aestuariispira insulae]RED52048.1 hypothetical protein DFP90_10265 [Aestuariispira insulae]